MVLKRTARYQPQQALLKPEAGETAWLQRYPLISFFGLTFAGSWTCGLLASLVKAESPALATLLLFAEFGRSPHGFLEWWARRAAQLAFALPALAGRLALVGTRLLLAFAGAHSGGACAFGAGWRARAIAGTGTPRHDGAEPVLGVFARRAHGGRFGWLGYALPKLQQRLGWRMASLGLGAVWGAWHLPLFFIDGTVQAQMPLGLFLLSIMAMSVMFSWLAERTEGSVVAALVLHTASNFWPTVVPILPSGHGDRPYAFVVAMQVLVALWLLASRRSVGARGGVAS